MHQGLEFPPFQSAFHCTLHDAVNLVPAESEQLGHSQLAGRFHPLNRQTFKQGGESRSGFRPRQLYHSDPVLRALSSWRVGVQDGLILTRV